MKPLKIKEVLLDDGSFNVVLTLTPKSISALKVTLEKAKVLSFSMLEWRGDYLQSEDNTLTLDLEEGLKIIKESFPHVPLIFTFRAKEEGGQRDISDQALYTLRSKVMDSHVVDLMDIEGVYLEEQGSESLRESYRNLLKKAKDKGIRVILSYHNFLNFPGIAVIVETFKVLSAQGADVVKIAVMVSSEEEVKELISISKDLKSSLTIPHILIGMGELGRASRFDDKFFNSCLTYGTLDEAMAPGQLSLKELEENRLK